MDLEQKKAIVDKLREGVVLVEFTKVNGEIRKMPCTLNTEYMNLPEDKDFVPSEFDADATSLSVWATDVDGWRSFRYDNVLTLEE